MLLIFAISFAGLIFIGYETYDKAPPIHDFITEKGEILISKQNMLKGQEIFVIFFLGCLGLRTGKTR